MAKTIKTATQAEMEVYKVLREADITLTGNIYMTNRPVNSDKEDIVIRTLAMNADTMQEGVINVNIHVPNLQLVQDNTQPDRLRLDAIGNECMAVLDDHWGDAFNFTLDAPGRIEGNGKDWFMNIRVRYYSIRIEIK